MLKEHMRVRMGRVHRRRAAGRCMMRRGVVKRRVKTRWSTMAGEKRQGMGTGMRACMRSTNMRSGQLQRVLRITTRR
jgi:hypothetical protein